MEYMKFVVLCSILMSTCFAVENQTLNLEKQIKIQKREKQYLIEDDPCDGPEQKREERQSSSAKMNLLNPKVRPKTINVLVQPKILPTPLKPILKPAKPINIRIDTTPQRIPTKIPVVLKTAKVIPAPAHALRLRMIENIKNDSILNKQTECINKENNLPKNKEEQITAFKEDYIPFTIEDKISSKAEGRMSANKEDEVISNQESKVILNKDGKVFFNKDGAVTTNIEGQTISRIGGQVTSGAKDTMHTDNIVTIDSDGKNTLNEGIKVVSKPAMNGEANFKKENQVVTPLDVKKPIKFFIDEADPLPPMTKKQSKPENQGAKNKEGLTKIKEIPITKKVKNKSKNDEPKLREDDEQSDHEPDIVRISNGTHIISIKKVRNKKKIENSRTGGQIEESRSQVEERIINQRPTKPSSPADEPEKFPSSCTESEENIILAVFGDSKKKEDKHSDVKHPDAKDPEDKDKEKDDCITVTNHNYEEFEERTSIPPAVQTNTYYDEGSRRSLNYLQNLQNLQNLYYNSYNQNTYDQYGRYYDVPQYDQNIKSQETNEPDVYTPECTQPYFPNENQPNYNVDYSTGVQPEIDVMTNCPEMLRSENTLDRIWRAWKDVEIKIKKSQNRDEPIDIDIRRNIFDSTGNNADVIGKVPIPYATQPIGLNGCYNNQNSALIYPYMNPAYRYMH